MSEFLAVTLSALPGLAALAAGVVRWRMGRRAGRAWRRTPPLARLALLSLFLLAFASCHSTHRGAYATGPVPTSKVPFNEPIRFIDGTEVPEGNGLLATYFAGAAYDRLDHQQIDPNVDFQWNADRQNPVVSGPGSLDFDECGFCGLPPSWGIWSIAWEGYLEAPAVGLYGLRVHVNNGGWLEMKAASGGLETIISCPGGPGFEGDCDTTVSLTVGRHYIRFSYYQNGPPSANSILSWSPPGAASFAVIPTAALWTQAAETRISRGYIFVHGIRGDFTRPGFGGLLDRLRTRYGQRNGRDLVQVFEYHQDVGHLEDRGCVSERPLSVILPYNSEVGYPVDLPAADGPRFCDSNDDVGVNGLFLEKDIARLKSALDVEKITLIANSMGAAVVRAYFAYASATRAQKLPGADTLEIVDGVLFLQGVQQGSYILNSRAFFDENPIGQRVRDSVADTARDLIGIDPRRPAAIDLRPQSRMIDYVNRLEHVPTGLHYLNVRSDIQLRPAVGVFNYRFPTTVGVGDYLLMPGDQNPTRTPEGGGAGILPSVVAAGRSSGQWTLRSEQSVFFETALAQIPVLVATQPESHLALGSKMGELCVETLRGRRRLDDAVFEALVALDRRRPDLDALNFGNLATTRCR